VVGQEEERSNFALGACAQEMRALGRRGRERKLKGIVEEGFEAEKSRRSRLLRCLRHV
jgi:hypothetical protein